MQVIDALSLDYSEWKKLIEEMGYPRFRVDQICQWIYSHKVLDYNGMSNVPKDLRAKLNENILMTQPILIKTFNSGGTIKYLWQLLDGERIESVLLNHGGHKTACISTQVGCPLACAFCATGSMGFKRNLSVGEILGQFLLMEKMQDDKAINKLSSFNKGSPIPMKTILFIALSSCIFSINKN